MYLKFENFEAMQKWAESKQYKSNARVIGVDRCLFGSPSYFFVADDPVHNLADGEMVIHKGLLTDEEKNSLVTLEEIKKDEQ